MDINGGRNYHLLNDISGQTIVKNNKKLKRGLDKTLLLWYNVDTKEREVTQMKIFVATNKRTEEEIRTPYLFEMIDTIKALGEKYGDKFSDWKYKVEKTS